MRIMGADQKEHYWDGEEEFLRGSVLVAIINLLPHVQVVIGTRIEVEWHAADVVEHEVGSGHVREVDECPRGFLRHAGDNVEEYLADEYQNYVDSPSTCMLSVMSICGCGGGRTLCIDPFCVQVGKTRLIAQLLQRLGRLLVDNTTATAPPSLFCLQRHIHNGRRV